MIENYLYPTLCLDKILAIYHSLPDEFKEVYCVGLVNNKKLLHNPIIEFDPSTYNINNWKCIHISHNPLNISDNELNEMHPTQRLLTEHYTWVGITNKLGFVDQNLIDLFNDIGFNSEFMDVSGSGYMIPIKKTLVGKENVYTRWKLKKGVKEFSIIDQDVFAIIPRESFF